MIYNQEDSLQLSGLQHFAFCRHQWALIHIEQHKSRTRRLPLDPVNAMRSFAYSLLSHDCAWALDLMEEFRPCIADRFVLSCINNRILQKSEFDFCENGAVFLNDSGKCTFLQRWQERKKAIFTHPFLGEKIPWGLAPYLQALLLARYLRGDLKAYLPFLWK